MSSFKTLLLGIVVIVLVGIGGLVYRNATEHPLELVACPLDAKVCPDGTSVARVGISCDFPACPPPNITLADTGLAFALPNGFSADASALGADPTLLGVFTNSPAASSTETIVIRQYPIGATSTALDVIQATALGSASGAPVPATAFTSTTIGAHQFTVAAIGRFEGVIDTAYYLAQGSDVLRFDAVDSGVADWNDPSLNVASLPAETALQAMLATLQGS